MQFGPSTGESFSFVVEFRQAGAAVTGSGGGLNLAGVRQGDTVQVQFSRAGGGGQFTWTIQSDGSLAGNFEDYGARNGGVSVARRIG